MKKKIHSEIFVCDVLNCGRQRIHGSKYCWQHERIHKIPFSKKNNLLKP